GLTKRSTLQDVAAAVAKALRSHGIRAVLTGGACATIYSEGEYQSEDLDLIIQSGPSRQELDKAMSSIGFRRQVDHYVHPRTLFFVEFPRGPLSIGSDVRIHPVEIRVGRRTVSALSATDSCRDRLAAFYHWNDRQSLDTAVAIALRNPVDLSKIRKWSKAENALEKFEEFRRELRRPAKKVPSARSPRKR